MSLDFAQVIAQVQRLVARSGGQTAERAQRLERAIALWDAWTGREVELAARLDEGEALWPVAGHLEPWNAVRPPAPLPASYTVFATDGSHVDVDRNAPARCFLVNIGEATLTYGDSPAATLRSEPALAFEDENLALEGARGQRIPLEGSLLTLKRAVMEMEALAALAEALPGDIPALALVDGPLLPWGLASYEQVPSQLEREFRLAMSRLEDRAHRSPVAVAGYISYPRAAEVIGLLRLAACPMEPPSRFPACALCQDAHRGDTVPCESALGGLLDRDLFWALLEPGERSPLFRDGHRRLTTGPGAEEAASFYLRTESEVARLEVPRWVAQDETLMSLAHALAWQQVERGQGYPVALQEAHERAVITTAERDAFWQTVERLLGDQRLPVRTSAKRRSKQLRWL